MLFLIYTACFGMVTNTNQSAEYIRMMNRNATTDLDAALYNPAGLTKLADGFYFYLSNQTIWQTREVIAAYPDYNEDKFMGTTFVPSFPNAYCAVKMSKLALFAGFAPIGGGGSAEFPDGLPSLDYELAKLVGKPAGLLTNMGLDPELADSVGVITGYSMESEFIGSSIYFAGQLGASYAFSKMLSAAFGLRYIYALNTYEGSLENTVLIAQNGNINGFIPDIKVDSKRTGSAFTGLFGLNISPMKALNIGLRYEHITKLQVVSDTKKDDTKGIISDTGMFPDSVTYNEDIPTQIAVGISYYLTPALRIETDFNYFFNKQCNWDGDEEKVTNDFDIGAGVEYKMKDHLWVSFGYLYSKSGATDKYQTDMDFGLNSNTIGAGLRYFVTPQMTVSLGTSNTFYMEGQNDDVGSIYEEKYNKTAFVIAAGFQYTF